MLADVTAMTVSIMLYAVAMTRMRPRFVAMAAMTGVPMPSVMVPCVMAASVIVAMMLPGSLAVLPVLLLRMLLGLVTAAMPHPVPISL